VTIRTRATWNHEGRLTLVAYDGRERVGFVRALPWPSLRHCGHDVERLRERGFNPRAIYAIHQSHLEPSHRGHGLGKEMYKRAFEAMVKRSGGTVLVGPEECFIGSGTSKDALRVWDSLAREYPSSGRVLAIGRRQGNPRRELPLRSVVEGGVLFETGVPVEFRFVRNTERSPYFGAKFQQDIEPAGRYMLHQPASLAGELAPGWESGAIRFERPLVLAFNTIPNEFYGDTSWKAALHQAYGKKTLALSNALISEGYDGIVTVGVAPEGHSLDTREIIDLGPIRQRRDQRRARRISAGRR
jgi:GNAT superfamily N-acetyltransferase